MAFIGGHHHEKIAISKTRLKIPFLESQPDLPGANELTDCPPVRYGSNFSSAFFKLILRINVLILRIDVSSTSCEIGVRWVPQNTSDDESTLVQVMAWCRQATSHYLSQCWPKSMLLYGFTRPPSVPCKFTGNFVTCGRGRDPCTCHKIL